MKNSLNSLVVVSIVVWITTGPAAMAQRLDSGRWQTEAEYFRAQLAALEQDLGRYHPALLQSLQGLAAALIELDQFSETDLVLDRAIQILRISEGLYTETQFPFLVLSISNNVRRGNWTDANETLEHLTFLYTLVPREWNVELINELVQISDLHLEGVAGDLAERKDYHFRAADRISWVATQVAARIWSPNDTRLVDLYYRLVVQNYMKHVTLAQGGAAASDLRKPAPNIGSMRPRGDVRGSYYRVGIEMLNRMRAVYELQDPPDLEAIAMVDLYIADWQVLFDESDPGSSYRAAYDRLVTAGLDEQVLGEYFRHPRPLPITRFYPSIAQAEVALLIAADQQEQILDVDADLFFLEWASTAPNMQLPIDEPMLLQQEIEDMLTARLAIRLAGTEKVVRWIRGRHISHVSVTDQFEWLGGASRRALTNESLTERLHYLNFRPALEQGVPQIYEGVLAYQYFPIDLE